MGVGLTAAVLIASLMQGVICSNDWSVTMPTSIRGVSGSCLRVPCLFQIPATFESELLNCSNGGNWKKGSPTGRTVFNSGRSKDKNIIQGEMIGNLLEKNCTTEFSSFPQGYNDLYIFRLDCPNQLKFNFALEVRIESQSEPPPPQLSAAAEVLEGQEVRLQCSVPVPCPALPPKLIWLPLDDRREEVTVTQEGQDGLISIVSTVTFTASDSHHNQTISCSVSYPLTQGGSTELSAATHTLQVQYVPKHTMATVSPSTSVSEGEAVALTCSSDANPPVQRYIWYREVNGQFIRRYEGNELLLLASRELSGVYLCEAQNRIGSQRSTPVEVTLNTDSSGRFVSVPSVLCGVVLVLYIVTVSVAVYKYRSLSRRLKIELKENGEHTYAALGCSSVTSEYDQLQTKTTMNAEGPYYQNPFAKEIRNQRSA